MRLLTKTTLYFLLAMIPLLSIGGYLLFSQFSSQINQRVDKELVYEEVQWIQYLEATTLSGGNFSVRSPDLSISPVDKEPSTYPGISTVYGNKAIENTRIPFRQLDHVVDINGSPYEIIIRKSQEQKLALVTNITYMMLLVFAGLFLATLLFNWIISNRLWQPFRDSLQKIRDLKLQEMEAVHFENTNTKEFNELNTSLNTMARKIESDYMNMKEFTENAAHEMQTPLAIAQTKLELLLQDSTLAQSQAQAIAQATTALARLSKLNQSLLLLAKIENHQFQAGNAVDLVAVTGKYLRLFDEIINDKQVSVETNFKSAFEVKMHPFLADSLISNLLGNAIKYTNEKGRISIHTDSETYCITNTSGLTQIQQEKLFQRFKTSADNTSSSTGLGLAIVKRIIDTNGLTIHYQYENESHRFCIRRD
jgi:signal transduction histidine kinase